MTTTAIPHSAEDAGGYPATRALFRYAVAAVVQALALISFGAMTTSTGSGMAFRGWPDSDGYYLWPANMDLAKFLEHFHRLMGATAGLLSIGLLIFVWRTDRRPLARKAAIGLLLLVIIQGLMGGRGVLKSLPVWNSVVHATLAQLFLCSLAVMALALSPGWRSRTVMPFGQVRAARNWGIVALVCILLQLIIGGVLRHSNDPNAKWIHVGFALVVSIAVLGLAGFCFGRFKNVPGMTGTSRWVLSILGLQLLLGTLTLLLRKPKDEGNIDYLGRASLQTAHVVIGATLFLLVALLVARCFRNLVPDGQPDQPTDTAGDPVADPIGADRSDLK